MIKSIWAILAGMLVNVILSTGTDMLLEALGIFTPLNQGPQTPKMLAVALSYRLIYTYLGGLTTGRLAPNRPMRHVIILGSIGTAVSIAGIFVQWDQSEHWYPIALAVAAFPVTWWGGVRGAIKMKHG